MNSEHKWHVFLFSLLAITIVISNFYFFIKNVKAFPSITQDSVVASQGTAEGEVYFPEGLSVDHLGNLYVADGWNWRIEEFDSSGGFVKTFGWGVQDGSNAFQICTSGCQSGIMGSGNGQFHGYQLNISPFRIANDSLNNLFVTDTSNNRIQEFAPDGSFLNQFGIGILVNPFGIVIDSVDNIYVSDRGHARIVEFDSNGGFVKTFGWGVQDGSNAFQICTVGCTTGHSGSGDGQFFSAEGITLDSSGNIYVADTGNNRIQKFDASGNFSLTWGTVGYNDGELFWPNIIKADSADNLYVVDAGQGNNRIQKFDSDGNFLASSTDHPNNNLYFEGYRGDLVFDSNDDMYLSYTSTNSGIHSKFLKLKNTLTPEISNVVPNMKLLGDGDATVDIYGTDFNPDIIASFNGINKNVTYVDTSHIQVDLTANDFTAIGTFPVTLSNPTPLLTTSPIYYFNVVDGNTSAMASIYVANPGNNDVSGLDSAGYDFSYFSTASTGSLSSLTITFPSGYVITDGDLTTDAVYPTLCYYDFGYACFNNSQINVTGAVGNSLDKTITITFDPITITGPFNLSFSIASGIKNPTVAGIKPGLDFIFLDNISGSVPVHSISDVNIIPAQLDHFSISNISHHLVKTPFDIIVTAQDQYNNTVDTFGNNVDITSTGTLSNGPFTSDPFVGGTLTQSVAFSNTGSFNITANTWEVTNPAVSNTFKITKPVIQVIQTCRETNTCPPPPPPPPINPITPIDPITPILPTHPVLPPPVHIPTNPTHTTTHTSNNTSTTTGAKPVEVIVTPTVVIPPPPNKLSTFLKSITLATTAKTIAAVGVASTLLSTPLSSWRALLSFLAIKKRKSWGTVYDSVTKQPLDPAYVVITDMQGNEINTSITDLDGRYGFLMEPGTYKITANKTNYTFPSVKLAGKVNDELYTDLYFGEPLSVTTVGEAIIKNIPLDPTSFDWNEYAKGAQHLLKFSSKKDLLIAKISTLIFYVGASISLIALVLTPKTFNISIAILYAVVFVARNTILKPKPQGTITTKDNTPLAFAILRIFSATTKLEIIHKVTDQAGKYLCLVPNGMYYATIERKNPDASYMKVFESDTFEVKGGVVKENFQF